MKNPNTRSIWMLCFCVVLAVVTGGCFTVSPSTTPMTFIRSDRQYAKYFKNLYYPGFMNRRDRVNVIFKAPAGTTIRFNAGQRVIIGGEEDRVLRLRDGVYPFVLKRTDGGKHLLSGAIMVRNMDKEVALATLGITDETKMFDEGLVRTALKGKLASYTVSFDGRDVITYWLGNRKVAYTGGKPTVELDFSKTPGITNLRVGGLKRANNRAVVDVYSAKRKRNAYGQLMAPEHAEHKIKFEADGRTFRGYVRKLKDNEFTAFVRIPCAIPQALLDAAAEGTVSKFTVQSTGKSAEPVAEIVISAM